MQELTSSKLRGGVKQNKEKKFFHPYNQSFLLALCVVFPLVVAMCVLCLDNKVDTLQLFHLIISHHLI